MMILACNMMTLYAPLILLGLPRNQTVTFPAITTKTKTWPQTVIFPAITTMTNTWSRTVILPAITTNLSHHRTGVVIKHIIIITVDS